MGLCSKLKKHACTKEIKDTSPGTVAVTLQVYNFNHSLYQQRLKNPDYPIQVGYPRPVGS